MFDFSSEFNFLVPYQSPPLLAEWPMPTACHPSQTGCCHQPWWQCPCFPELHSPARALTCSLSLCLLLSWVSSSWFSVDGLHVTSQGYSPSLFQQDLWFGWLAMVSFPWMDPRSVTVLVPVGVKRGAASGHRAFPQRRMIVYHRLSLVVKCDSSWVCCLFQPCETSP